MNTLELFGIISSTVIFISLSMTSIVKLRWINTVGCILFSIYGFLIGSFSTMFLNLGIALLNIYYLKKIYSTKDTFFLVETNTNTQYFDFFIHNNYKDIEYFFAKFTFDNLDKIFFLVRNNTTVGVIGWIEEDENISIQVDYIIPEYRDLKFGKYLFIENLEFFKSLGYKSIHQKPTSNEHREYLKKIGFSQISNDLYIKNIY